MKNRVFSIIVLLLLVVLTACTSKTITTQTVNESVEVTATEAVLAEAVQTEAAPTEAVSTDAQTEATATLNVDALIREKLQNHHNIERVYNAKHTREEWNATLDRMIGYGAKISEEEKQIIIDYLMNR